MLLGGVTDQYKNMYEKSYKSFKNNFFRPMTPQNLDILISGDMYFEGETGKGVTRLEPEASHLVSHKTERTWDLITYL